MSNFSGLIKYHYTMGFAVDGVAIPDPTSFGGKISDLDSMGKRNANGDLVRHRVATKHKCEFEYSNIEWEMMKFICDQFDEKQKFTFSYPDPQSGVITLPQAYVGDRDWTAVYSPSDGVWIGTLKFNIIEY